MNAEAHFLLRKIKEINDTESRSGVNFNIFKIIELTTDEVRVHSKFIAELLNPRGTHGLQNFFLESFLKIPKISTGILKSTSPEFIESFLFKARVLVEHSIPKNNNNLNDFGRIDILIENHDSKKGIIIENKVYAREQKRQIRRYYDFGNKKYGDKNFVVFYLTLDGKQSSNEETDQLEEGIHYHSISYINELRPFLISCLNNEKTNARISNSLDQYINLISHLTNIRNMKPEIVNEIIKDKSSFSAALAINQQIIYAKGELQKRFWKIFLARLQKLAVQNDYSLENCLDIENDVNEYYKSHKREYGVTIKKIIPGLSSFSFRIEIGYDYLFFGIPKKQDLGFNQPIIFHEIVNKFNDKYSFSTSISNWWGWKYFEPKIPFWNFSNDTLDLVFNTPQLNSQIENILEEFSLHISEFEKIILDIRKD